MFRTMRDATGAFQSVLILGGNSDLAAAVVDQLAQRRLQRVVLAARDTEAAGRRAADWSERGLTCEVLPYDANDPAAHDTVLAQAGPVDLVLLAFGTLGEPYTIAASTESVVSLAQTNFVGGVGAAHAAARHLSAQGHGTLVVFSSVAGARVRAANAVYGATKAGLDGFAQGLSDALRGTGVDLMIVRPGFVHTKMTEGMKAAPFATTAEAVAADVLRGLSRRQRVIWSPGILRGVFGALRVLPNPIWRRLG
jgi:decaprenylphospho-beta-D-erythro-pentofuranosid-2-ulose 2-reductase